MSLARCPAQRAPTAPTQERSGATCPHGTFALAATGHVRSFTFWASSRVDPSLAKSLCTGRGAHLRNIPGPSALIAGVPVGSIRAETTLARPLASPRPRPRPQASASFATTANAAASATEGGATSEGVAEQG